MHPKVNNIMVLLKYNDIALRIIKDYLHILSLLLFCEVQHPIAVFKQQNHFHNWLA